MLITSKNKILFLIKNKMGTCVVRDNYNSRHNENDKELMKCTLENTPSFSLENQEFDAKIIKVYDGDTVTVALCYNNKFYKFNCRLLGIDTPELKSKVEHEKILAENAKNFLVDCINDKKVRIETGKWDKYGRLLVVVFINNININSLMVQRGFAKEYDGKTKNTEW